MKDLNELLGYNTNLSAEEYRLLETGVFTAARRDRIARLLYPAPIQIPFGKAQYSYDVWTEMGGAVVVETFEKHRDTGIKTRTDLTIPIIEQGFFVERRNLESSRTDGTPLDTSLANLAGYQVHLQEEAMLLDGITKDGTTYEYQGFYQAAGNTEATAADFGTAGKGITKMGLALAVLATDNIFGPFNMVLHPTQYNQLLTSVHTGGISEWDAVKNIIGGEIYQSTAMTAGQGMLVQAPGTGAFDLVIARDMTVEFNDDWPRGTLGMAYEIMTPVIRDTNAICTLTGI